jgi:hypothetical protein
MKMICVDVANLLFLVLFGNPYYQKYWRESGFDNFKTILTLRDQVDRIRYLPYIILKRYPDNYRKKYKQYVEIIQNIYQKIKQVNSKALIVDSSKDISTLYLLADLPFIKLHVIHMVRDGRAVAYSRQRKRVNPQVVNQTNYLAIYSPRKAAFDWIYRNSIIEFGKPFFDSYRFIRYEDLINDPITQIRQLCSSLGVLDANLSFIKKSQIYLSRPAHTVSGNPMRFQSGHLELRLDSAWQEEMKLKDKRVVTGLTWPLLKRYNYDLCN